MKGRKPSPKSLTILRGNPSKRKKSAAGDPEFIEDIPIAPDFLAGGALLIYRRNCEILSAAHVLTAGDRDLLARLSWITHTINQQSAKLENENMIVETERGAPVPNPRARIIRDLIPLEAKLQAEAGLSPTARNRLKTVITPREPKTKDETLAEKLFSGAKIKK